MRSDDFIKNNVEYHNSLNIYVWRGNEMRTEVRYKLLEIAKHFIDYLDVEGFRLEDVVLRGSLTNYNYTEYSDFDLHLVTDYNALQCNDLAAAFYKAKKQIWNDAHDITIHGHEVELYVEDRDEPNASQGAYSVLDGTWLKTPTFDPPEINDLAVNAKTKTYMREIDQAITATNVDEMTRIKEKIGKMRKAALADSGEYSTENLVFKILRNQGYLDRLSKAIVKNTDQQLSLDEDQ